MLFLPYRKKDLWLCLSCCPSLFVMKFSQHSFEIVYWATTLPLFHCRNRYSLGPDLNGELSAYALEQLAEEWDGKQTWIQNVTRWGIRRWRKTKADKSYSVWGRREKRVNALRQASNMPEDQFEKGMEKLQNPDSEPVGPGYRIRAWYKRST